MDKLVVFCSKTYTRERQYIYDVVFRDFWGLDYSIQYNEQSDAVIMFGDKELHIADKFFQMPKDDWLKKKSLPALPLNVYEVPDAYLKCVTKKNLPILYGSESKRLFNEDNTYCNLDIFGSAFFMLTRYEEVVIRDRDELDRFSAYDSVAYKADFIERPIINEYLEILWRWMTKFFSGLNRKNRQFSIMPTHDVDFPFWSLAYNKVTCLRMFAGDILKRRSLSQVWQHLGYCQRAIMGDYNRDPHNTFDMIMDISESYNLTSNFYFMTSRGRDKKDGNYDIMHPEVCKLARKMLERGHKIGIHPGFGSKDNLELIKTDVDKLRQMIVLENLQIKEFGGRQHYLHWSAPNTWAYYEALGIKYDTTLSYANHIGFRCGICYDYPVYNVVTRERYKLREYPLIVMECSGLTERYMNLSYEEMIARCKALRDKVKKYQGTFVILWHNTSFMTRKDIECYKRIIG